MIFSADYTFAGHMRWNLGWPSPNYAAAFLATVIPWCWSGLFIARSSGRWVRRLCLVGIAILELVLWLAILKTYSRSGLIAVLAAGACFSICLRGALPWGKIVRSVVIRGCCIAIAIGVIGFFARLAPGYIAEDASVLNRLELWRGALKMIAASPLRGWGFGESGSVYTNWFQAIGADERYTGTVNSFLEVATDQGLPVLALVLAGAWVLVRFPWNDTNATNPLFGPVFAGAKASLVAWISANLFTTLWIDLNLWIVPSVCIFTLLIVGRSFRISSLLRQTAIGFGLGAAVAASLWIAGRYLSNRSDVAVVRGPGNTVIATSPSAPVSNSSESVTRDWELWADRSVLGPFPGQEIRLWLKAMPSGTRVVSRDPTPYSGRPRHVYGVILFGRQVDRLGELLESGLTEDEVWVVHPSTRTGSSYAAHLAKTHLNLVLPEIDQCGQSAHWLAWAKANGASVVTSIGVGTDIRAAWPETLCGNDCARLFRSRARSPAAASSPKPDQAVLPLPADQLRLWLVIQSSFHGIGLDGGWRQSYQLGGSSLTRALSLACRLDHRLDLDANGRPHSLWRIPALETWLVPSGRNKLEFMPPTGSPLLFQLDQITDRFEGSDSPSWRIRRASPGCFELLSPARVLWTYSHGLLTRISSSLAGDLVVRTNGGLICEIRNLHSEPAGPLLSADHDEFGNPTRFDIGDSGPNVFAWEAGELTGLQRGNGTRIGLSYVDGLISTICDSSRPPIDVTWSENLGFGRGNSLWPHPVSLRTDDAFAYRFTITNGGYLIKITNRSTGATSTVFFNPLRHQLRQYDSTGREFLVSFYNSGAGTSPKHIDFLRGSSSDK